MTRFLKPLVIGCLLVCWSMSAPLSSDDYQHLQKQKRTETLVYEVCRPSQINSFTLIGAQFDRYLSDNVYIGGTAYGAVSGGRGGYALGSFNVGYKVGYPFFCDVKVMIGGSGGGGVPVQGGLMIEPIVTIGYTLSNSLEIRLGVGKYISLDNDFSADIYNIGISFSAQHLFLPNN